MKKIIGVVTTCVLMMGCSSQPVKKLYLNTQMQSLVSGPTTISLEADRLLPQKNISHLNLYPMQPLPGKAYRDDLDRKFAAAKMYIKVTPDADSRTVEISGQIDYYDHQQYNNAHLVGESIKTFNIPKRTVELTYGKPVVIELPRGIQYSLLLTDQLQ
ncbi:hypothetical protein [Enterobacter hormaechei]|uniref:hypothetical protein n=1 Tax=Enterobacter ludwigii TaxID=299767 RepID=UPI0037DCF1B8|nr:hypothetical protein [Klebsiella aerogenes]